METPKITQQIIEMQKSAFENAFNAVVAIQNQAEAAMNMMLHQSQLLPENGLKAVSEWIDTYNQGRDSFKAYVDDNFKKTEAIFVKPKTETKETKKKSK